MDPLEWQISQDTANSIVAWLANTVGAAESVLRVAATGHDKRLFVKVNSKWIQFIFIFTWSQELDFSDFEFSLSILMQAKGKL